LIQGKWRWVDATEDVYVCSAGRRLKTTGTVHDGKTRLYRSSKFDCDPCPLKSKCCPKLPNRKIPRDVNEDARDVARALRDTPAFDQSRRDSWTTSDFLALGNCHRTVRRLVTWFPALHDMTWVDVGSDGKSVSSDSRSSLSPIRRGGTLDAPRWGRT
jgi:hypothetical protein